MRGYGSRMDDKLLRPATRQELHDTLRYALRYRRNGKPHRHADDFMTQIAAETLAEHLELSGFVVMKKPSAAPPTDSAHRGSKIKLTE